jgi:hydroxymethylbilane synthase
VKEKLIIGTRSSKLALWQAEFVAATLRSRYPELTVELKHIVTKGDKILHVPLAKIGGKGLFTKELENEMLQGHIDLAVHSLKDVPAELPQGLTLAAIMQRATPFDALVCPRYGTLDNLPSGARVGTSSLRRTAQLLHYRPDLTILSLRGNVDTRLRKLDDGEYEAIILAAAGLERLGLSERITQLLPPSLCLPAVGQGALALESRADDTETLQLTAPLNDTATAVAVQTERAFLSRIEGGCQIPVGVYGTLTADHQLSLEAVIASPDGRQIHRRQVRGSADSGPALGTTLADELLQAGGQAILQELGLCVTADRRK